MGRRSIQLFVALMALGCLAGCRNCRGFDRYACVIDHIQDYPVLFDTWYRPRLDISRAGKPDWCGPVNRLVSCRRCDCIPQWDRYDDIWLYPPGYPHEHPGAVFPGPSQFRSDAPAEFRDGYESETINVEPDELPPPVPWLEGESPDAVLPDAPLPESPK